MAQKIIILSTRESDRATFATNYQLPSLPASNAQYQEPTQVWRTTGTLDQYVNITFPSAKVVDTAAFAWYDNIYSASALCRLQAFATLGDVGVTPAVDSGWLSVWPSSGKHTAEDWGPNVGFIPLATNGTPYQYYRWYISDAAAPQTYLDVSRLALGKKTQFKLNPRIDGSIAYIAIDVQEANGFGQIFTDPRPYQQRQFNLVWSALGAQDVEQDAMELARLRGQAGDFFVFMTPDATTDFHIKSMQAVFENAHKFVPVATHVRDKDGSIRAGWAFVATMNQKL